MARVRDKEDARRLAESARESPEPGRVPRAAEVAPPTGAGSAGVIADPADVIELDYDEILAVEAELARRHDELSRYLADAAKLGTTLRDGSSPVTRPMRTAFGLRGGNAAGGLQAALQGYLTELTALRRTIGQVRATHEQNDQAAAQALRPE
ncbi:hypothetical protein L3Q67_43535 [Saccharothrix sp. AJ9571]|nr:hypothetical protein L3Q67_43535 [Saccharothrix sp. AJ9571]